MRIPTTVYLTPMDIAHLEEIAKKRATSRSSIIRLAVKKFLEDEYKDG